MLKKHPFGEDESGGHQASEDYTSEKEHQTDYVVMALVEMKANSRGTCKGMVF
jgi:hypothetical protein